MKRGVLASSEVIYALPKGRIIDWVMPQSNEPLTTVQFVTCCRDIYSLDIEKKSIEAKIKVQTIAPKEKIHRVFSVPSAASGDVIVYAFGEENLYRVDMSSEMAPQTNARLPEHPGTTLAALRITPEEIVFAYESPRTSSLYTFTDSRISPLDSNSRFNEAYFSESAISGDLGAFSLFFHDNHEAKPVPNAVYSNIIQSTTTGESFILEARRDERNEIIISSISNTGHSALVYQGKHMQEERGPIMSIHASINDKQQITMLLLSADGSLTLVRNKKRLWTRDDELSNVLQTKFFALPLRAVVEHAGALSELREQFQEFVSTLVNSFTKLTSILGTPQDTASHHSAELFNDNQGFNRLIVSVTATNKVFAFHTHNGEMIWSFYYPSVSKENILHPDETLSIHACNRDSFYLVSTRDALVTRVELLSGKILSQKKFSSHFERVIDYAPRTVMEDDEHHTNILLLLTAQNQIHLYPNTKTTQEIIQRDGKDIFFFNADRASGQLRGYTFLSQQVEGTTAQEAWTQSLRAPIAALTTVAQSAVYSTVYQTGSGEVLHKYLSRHLIAVATLREIKSNKVSSFTPHALDLYVINSVTGSILFHTNQEFVNGPIRLIFEHNVLLCQFLNEKSRKYELSVYELFSTNESHTDRSFVEALFGQDPHKDQVVSSFELGIPNIARQSYVLPTGSVETLGVTQTARGLTQKHFLFGMTNGRVIHFDKRVLDPRRPQGAPTKESMAEGLAPYNPFLQVSSAQQYLLHNYTVANIREIISHPSDMESTTHVLVRGTDLFYTRHAPSGAFDMLGADFSHILLLATIVGMALLSKVAKYFAQRRSLQEEWE